MESRLEAQHIDRPNAGPSEHPSHASSMIQRQILVAVLMIGALTAASETAEAEPIATCRHFKFDGKKYEKYLNYRMHNLRAIANLEAVLYREVYASDGAPGAIFESMDELHHALCSADCEDIANSLKHYINRLDRRHQARVIGAVPARGYGHAIPVFKFRGKIWTIVHGDFVELGSPGNVNLDRAFSFKIHKNGCTEMLTISDGKDHSVTGHIEIPISCKSLKQQSGMNIRVTAYNSYKYNASDARVQFARDIERTLGKRWNDISRLSVNFEQDDEKYQFRNGKLKNKKTKKKKTKRRRRR